MENLKYAGLLVLAVITCGCGWFFPETEPVQAIRFGVLNSLPRYPLYIRADAGSPGGSPVRDIFLKDRISKMAVQFLEHKGYEAVVIEDHAALASDRVDMMIEILPGQLFGMPALSGYGFSGRAMPWKDGGDPPWSFVSVQLSLHRAHSTRIIGAGPLEKVSQLETGPLSCDWNELVEADRNHLADSLGDDAAKAVYLLLSRLKI